MILSFSSFLNSAQRIILRLERLDEGLTIAAEIVPDDIVHSLLNEIVGKFELFLGKRLHNQLAIDQILERGIPGRLDLLRQLLPLELRMQQSLARPGKPAHLRVGDDIAVHDGRDAVNNLALGRERALAERRKQQRKHSQHGGK